MTNYNHVAPVAAPLILLKCFLVLAAMVSQSAAAEAPVAKAQETTDVRAGLFQGAKLLMPIGDAVKAVQARGWRCQVTDSGPTFKTMRKWYIDGVYDKNGENDETTPTQYLCALPGQEKMVLKGVVNRAGALLISLDISKTTVEAWRPYETDKLSNKSNILEGDMKGRSPKPRFLGLNTGRFSSIIEWCSEYQVSNSATCSGDQVVYLFTSSLHFQWASLSVSLSKKTVDEITRDNPVQAIILK